jgi:hypothetical protein
MHGTPPIDLRPQGMDAKTVERDYVLTHVLAAISRQLGNHGMAFKGVGWL